jgi:hypothetical protein
MNLPRWYINRTITILDIIHRPVFYLKLKSMGLSVPHRKHITSPLRAQQVNVMYRFVTMAYYYNYHNSEYYPLSFYLKRYVSENRSVSVFKLNLLSWIQSTELVSVCDYLLDPIA